MQNTYVIRKGDMLIRPLDNAKYPEERTEVKRYNNNHIIVDDRVQKIMERSCKFYGDNYAGRKLQTRRLTNIANKIPVLLTPLFPTYFFPTHSDRSVLNMWLNIHYIEQIASCKGSRSKVYFANQEFVIIDISYHSIWHQYQNAIYYYYLMDKNARLQSSNPDEPIDYTQTRLNLFEALSRYSLLEKK